MLDAPDETKPQPIALAAAQAATLLKGDLRNLAKKVQQGKTLSASERNLLQSALAGETPAADEYAKNAVQLAAILGVDRKTVQRWRKIDGNPGVRPDGRYHVPSWRAWKLARQGDGSEGEELSQSILRARQILLQNQKLEFQLAVLRREYVPASDVDTWGATLGSPRQLSLERAAAALGFVALHRRGIHCCQGRSPCRRHLAVQNLRQ